MNVVFYGEGLEPKSTSVDGITSSELQEIYDIGLEFNMVDFLIRVRDKVFKLPPWIDHLFLSAIRDKYRTYFITINYSPAAYESICYSEPTTT